MSKRSKKPKNVHKDKYQVLAAPHQLEGERERERWAKEERAAISAPVKKPHRGHAAQSADAADH